MSRRSQDIPIRPRYGIQETEEEDGSMEKPSSSNKLNKSKKIGISNNNSINKTFDKMASSYSEIPFLAQFAENSGNNDITPTDDRKGAAAEESENNSSDNIGHDGNEPGEDIDSSEGATGNDSKDSSSCDFRKELDKIKQKRPSSLHCDSSFPYELERTGHEGEMRHFVADNLEQQLRAGSPLNKSDQYGLASRNSTPSNATASGLLTRHFLQAQVPQMDANVLSDIEIEAQYLAASVDNLTENLCNLLHSISSITADNVEVHKNSVNKLTDHMDANIKCMYTIMAKTEEISKSMKPTEQLGQRIREIKRLVDMLDAAM